MDNNEEYHDPDYPGTSVRVKEELPSLSEQEKEEKIRNIIQTEFKNEIDVRENEVMLADQRMTVARRMLHRLRYALVARYYRERRLQQPEGAAAEPEASTTLRSGQRRLHPSVRKLLGRKTADMEEIFRPLATRNKRRDYSAMLATRNYTIPADGSSSLRPGGAPPAPPAPAAPAAPAAPPAPRRAPRRLQPRPEHVLTLDELTRNKVKHRYRIIIGNTSKYAPAASAMDRSTHKWLLYVRGVAGAAAAHLLRAVTVTLHHSYAPHHTIHIDKPPYHISRRGWGEFPAKVELHFRLPDRNRPATVEHTIKLDRDYTGLQTLGNGTAEGAETLVDVWLYSTPDMLEFEYKEEDEPPHIEDTITPKEEPIDQEEPANEPEPTDNWLDFFTTNTKELDVDEMIIKPVKKETVKENIENNLDDAKDVKPDILEIENNVKMVDVKLENDKMDWNLEKSIINPSETIPNEILSQPASPKKRIMKYLDPQTGKIYYLEMDRKLDLSKVQEIVINSKGNMKTAKLSPVKPLNGKKRGVSLLKPEIKNMLNNKEKKAKNFTHIINDHCYLGNAWVKNTSFSVPPVKSEVIKKEESLYECLCADVARFSCVRVAVNYLLKKIPIVTEKARDPEFKRCFPFVERDELFWKMDFAKRRNKEWSRAKLINTILTEHFKASDPVWRTKQILIFSRLHGYHPIRKETLNTTEWSWNDMEPNTQEFSTISAFKPEEFNNSITEFIDDSDDEEIEVVKDEPPMKVQVKKEDESSLVVIPVEREEDRQRFMFIERKCADIGVELRNEDVGNGYSYSAVHAVMLSALKSFAEELVRNAVAADLLATRTELPPTVWTGWAAAGAVRGAALAAAAARSRLAALAARDAGARPQRQDEPI